MKPQLHGMNVTSNITEYQKSHPKMFHTLGYSPHSGALLFTLNPLDAQLFLRFNSKQSVSNLQVYDICIGSIDGLSCGLLFYSPLKLKSDIYYLLFYRNQTTVETLESAPLEKRLVTDIFMLLSSIDAHYLVIRGNSKLVSFLDSV